MMIIVILLSVLLPSLAMSRNTTKLARCAVNQRHIGTAMHNYAVDMNGMIPYGPRAEPSSIADFYVVDGMVTSQISLLSEGRPVGIGLLLKRYLSWRPEILFCPDPDQPFDAKRELERFGKSQSLSTYLYRHGSNILKTLSAPREQWNDHIRLQDLGLNRNGQPIRALLMDQNFVVNRPVPAFNIVTRTNHRRGRTNALFVDSHVETLNNGDDHFTADIGSSLHAGPNMILTALEHADTE